MISQGWLRELRRRANEYRAFTPAVVLDLLDEIDRLNKESDDEDVLPEPDLTRGGDEMAWKGVGIRFVEVDRDLEALREKLYAQTTRVIYVENSVRALEERATESYARHLELAARLDRIEAGLAKAVEEES